MWFDSSSPREICSYRTANVSPPTIGYSLMIEIGYSLMIEIGYSLMIEIGYSLMIEIGYSSMIEIGYSSMIEIGYSLMIEVRVAAAIKNMGYSIRFTSDIMVCMVTFPKEFFNLSVASSFDIEVIYKKFVILLIKPMRS